MRRLDVVDERVRSAGHLLPGVVRELLRPVRMALGRTDEAVECVVGDALVGCVEAVGDERAELIQRDHPDLHSLRAPPERLVAVLEDLVEDVAAAPEIDV